MKEVGEGRLINDWHIPPLTDYNHYIKTLYWSKVWDYMTFLVQGGGGGGGGGIAMSSDRKSE